MLEKGQFNSIEKFREGILMARGIKESPLVIKNSKYIDLFNGEICKGDIAIYDGKIVGIGDNYQGLKEYDAKGMMAIPGLIDSHVHIESGLLVPSQYERVVLPKGTTTVIWDPHEIGNVWGKEGIDWAIKASEELLLDVFIMLPSCVPATDPCLQFETSAYQLLAVDLGMFYDHPRVIGLAEMMNYPGLLKGNQNVMDTIFKFTNRKRDGHCPGLAGNDLNAYAMSGIHTCHESSTAEEAREKLQKGISLLIREGSCAKNAKTLLDLINDYTSMVTGFCSDDRNPLDIHEEGHINAIVNMGLEKGHDLKNILRVASLSSARMYNLNDRGAIAPGYLADICLVEPKIKDQIRSGIEIKEVFKKGQVVSEYLERIEKRPPANVYIKRKNMNLAPITTEHLKIKTSKNTNAVQVRVIDVIAEQILTNELIESLSVHNGEVLSDIDRDLLKIVVLERHKNTGNMCTGFIHGFGLKKGAMACSIGHDSHNLIAIGATDEDIVGAVNHLIQIDGGIVVWENHQSFGQLALPIGGLMTNLSGDEVVPKLKSLKSLAYSCGCKIKEPFIQMSFLSLPVIPKLKITDLGLVDVDKFEKVSVLIQ